MIYILKENLLIVLIVLFACSCDNSDNILVDMENPEIEVPEAEDPPELVEPKNTTGTLLDRNGKMLRGVPMPITQINSNDGVPFSANVNNWIKLRDEYGINTVRVCWFDLWLKMRGAQEDQYWNIDEAMPHIDKCVENAIATGMNVIINYHVTGENMAFKNYAGEEVGIDFNRNHDERIEFWTRIAKKYKGNNLVFFELSNEPNFWHSYYLNETFKKNLLEVYNIVRKEAPNRQILLFSFNGTHYDLKSVVENYSPDIDWSRTSVAFHAYEDTSSAKIQELMSDYRIICTEWDYYGTHDYVKKIDGELLTAQTMERLGISWVDWYNKESTNSLNRLENVLLPDAKTKNYWWGN
ncbi:cellulase family glycosylhydrolase [Joostella atrarenae]|uniref:Cellulase family glycosylhydrolase n=1 Tax=Joostella atrarenae TaxID=679257 RepID=A0ABS9J2L9_9FLAO|nr:cellulase family glycosylhydrolase [Joostella atrarenae]MCF8714686.1 cellulase family glycosylhydrolase [Joostella atrarenae]